MLSARATSTMASAVIVFVPDACSMMASAAMLSARAASTVASAVIVFVPEVHWMKASAENDPGCVFLMVLSVVNVSDWDVPMTASAVMLSVTVPPPTVVT